MPSNPPSSSSPDLPTRHVVSVAVRATDGSGRILAVRRPLDDPDLPGLWGLPAGRIHPGEELEAAVRRMGREKLGVELERLRSLRSGTLQRTSYRLQMGLFEATLAAGARPDVPQPVEGVTQYTDWRWADPGILEPAAEEGSLCCRLYLGRVVDPPA
jgi:8-oxo-dGTP diphosphatase